MTPRRIGFDYRPGRLLIALLLGLTAVLSAEEPLSIASPGKINTIRFWLAEDGSPRYAVDHGEMPVVRASRLGFRLAAAPDLAGPFEIADVASHHQAGSYTLPWGEVERVEHEHVGLTVELRERNAPTRTLVFEFRAYDDGIAFRARFPEQPALDTLVIMDELTEFAFSGDHTAWWIPAYRGNRYEFLYERTPISAMDTVHTPLTMQTGDGLFLSLHEAALVDFASMTLASGPDHTLACDLVPWRDGVKVRASTPHATPWRTLQIAETAGDLITSHLILNLNEPSVLDDVSWVQPMKYVGIWWGMHVGTMTWHQGPLHGATTANAKEYIDFAAEHGFGGVLIEGWNYGWDGDWGAGKTVFKFTEPYPDFDIAAVTDYAREKGVMIIGHHETGGVVQNYEAQMDDAFAYYARHGIHAVKTGYVQHRLDGREWHHGQYGVRHYQKSVETAARHRVAVNIHEPIKDTGLRRTWPNLLSREGARGMEYDAWASDGGNPPSHHVILPFTRMLSGPFDFTPGIFDLLHEDANPRNRVNTTLAKQLAFYVTIYSPIQMVADLPENYARYPVAFQFIKDVPVDWSQTRVLHAAIGEYVTIARKARGGDDWYIGSMTGDAGQRLEAVLDFLDPGRRYTAEIYADGPNAHWETHPTAFDFSKRAVTTGDTLVLTLAPGGGAAVRLRAE